eukprot:gene28944-35902_t
MGASATRATGASWMGLETGAWGAGSSANKIVSDPHSTHQTSSDYVTPSPFGGLANSSSSSATGDVVRSTSQQSLSHSSGGTSIHHHSVSSSGASTNNSALQFVGTVPATSLTETVPTTSSFGSSGGNAEGGSQNYWPKGAK